MKTRPRKTIRRRPAAELAERQHASNALILAQSAAIAEILAEIALSKGSPSAARGWLAMVAGRQVGDAATAQHDAHRATGETSDMLRCAVDDLMSFASDALEARFAERTGG
jgi:hypothetical protein